MLRYIKILFSSFLFSLVSLAAGINQFYLEDYISNVHNADDLICQICNLEIENNNLACRANCESIDPHYFHISCMGQNEFIADDIKCPKCNGKLIYSPNSASIENIKFYLRNNNKAKIQKLIESRISLKGLMPHNNKPILAHALWIGMSNNYFEIFNMLMLPENRDLIDINSNFSQDENLLIYLINEINSNNAINIIPIIKSLLDAGIDVDFVDSKSNTALIKLCSKLVEDPTSIVYKNLILMIMDYSPNIYHKNINNYSAIDILQASDNNELQALIDEIKSYVMDID